MPNTTVRLRPAVNGFVLQWQNLESFGTDPFSHRIPKELEKVFSFEDAREDCFISTQREICNGIKYFLQVWLTFTRRDHNFTLTGFVKIKFVDPQKYHTRSG